MTDWVRVSDAQTGVYRTTDRRELEANSQLRELKQAATDLNGRPLPPKFKTEKVEKGSEPKAAEAASTTEATKEAAS